MTGAPLATVLIVTYNHEKHIAAAIDSALAQKTLFPFEILISEDASTDGTAAIVQDYAVAYPHIVTLVRSDRNIGSNEVVARGLRQARGRYLALLDGDDFWTSETKLQEQSDYLETNAAFSAVFHNAAVAVGDKVTENRWTPPDQASIVKFDDIWQGNPFATCAGMMRTECIRHVPSWYAELFPITDWPLYVLCARAGALAFIDKVTGCYRLHPGGLFSSLPDQSKHDAVERFYQCMLSVVDRSEVSAARGGYSRYFFDLAERHLENGEVSAARSCFRRSLRGGGVGQTVSKREVLLLGFQLFKARPLRHEGNSRFLSGSDSSVAG